MKLRNPQEKKKLSYERDRRNVYGEAPMGLAALKRSQLVKVLEGVRPEILKFPPFKRISQFQA